MAAAPPSKELGQSEDPTELVPGTASTVTTAATEFASISTSLETIGTSLRTRSAPGWTGLAADSFRIDWMVHTAKWPTLSDQFDKAATALSEHAGVITAAQERAGLAVQRWNEGEAESERALQAHNQAVREFNQEQSRRATTPSGGLPSSPYPQIGGPLAPPYGNPWLTPGHPGPFLDTGEAIREEAREILAEAREMMAESADRTIAALGGMPGAHTTGSSSGPSASAEGEWLPDFSFEQFSENYGTRDQISDFRNRPDGGPFSMTIARGEAQASVWRGEGSVEDYWGDVAVGANGEINVLSANADGRVVIDGAGLTAEGRAGVYALDASGEARAEYGYLEGGVSGEAMAGAEVAANVTVGPQGVHASGEAFAGARIGGDVDVSVGGVGVTGGAEGWAGVGVAGELDFGMTEDGRFRIGGSGGAALGLGGKLEFGIEIDPAEVMSTVNDIGDGLTDFGRGAADFLFGG